MEALQAVSNLQLMNEEPISILEILEQHYSIYSPSLESSTPSDQNNDTNTEASFISKQGDPHVVEHDLPCQTSPDESSMNSVTQLNITEETNNCSDHEPPKFDNCLPGCGYSGLPCFVCSTHKLPKITIKDTSEDGMDVVTDTVVLVWLETLLRHRRRRQFLAPEYHSSLAHYLRQPSWQSTHQHHINVDIPRDIHQYCYHSPDPNMDPHHLCDEIIRMKKLKRRVLQNINYSYQMDSRRNKWYRRTAGIALAVMIFIILLTLLLLCLMWLWG